MKNVIWLASYPKSGNTWLRIIITNLVGEQETLDINDMEKAPISSSRQIIKRFCGFNESLLPHEKSAELRPYCGDSFAKECEEIIFRKCHDAFTYLANGQPLLGNPKNYKAIYIIRNPLSVVASYANHNGSTIDRAIELINDEEHGLCMSMDKLTNQLRQQMFSWSGHVKSWLDQKSCDVCVVRYEDLHKKPVEILQEAFTFSGYNFSDQELLNAVEKSSFKKIKKLEKNHTFQEKPSKARSFFRSGKTDSWEKELTSEQAAEIISKHWQIMGKFGYLNNDVLKFAKLNKHELNKN